VAVGDWVVAGCWVKAENTTNGFNQPAIAAVLSATLDTAVDYFALGHPIKGDGEWEWIANAAKVTAGAGSREVLMELRFYSTNPHRFYAPILLHIPTGTISDTEALELVQHLASWPDGAPVGHVSTIRDQKLIARGGIGVGNSVAATTPGSVTKKMEIFDQTGASLGFVPIYSTIT
jgi:hypothetical protein